MCVSSTGSSPVLTWLKAEHGLLKSGRKDQSSFILASLNVNNRIFPAVDLILISHISVHYLQVTTSKNLSTHCYRKYQSFLKNLDYVFFPPCIDKRMFTAFSVFGNKTSYNAFFFLHNKNLNCNIFLLGGCCFVLKNLVPFRQHFQSRLEGPSSCLDV